MGCRNLIVLVGVLGMCCGCDTRVHDNPLDPSNSATRGEGPGFDSVAGNGEITIVWSDLGLTDLDEIRVLRWVSGGDAETQTGLSGDIGRWVDTSVLNGTTYGYRVMYVIEGDPTIHLSNSDRSTPGVERPWVIDESRGGIRRIAPDGRDLKWKLSSDEYFRSLSIDGKRRRVWAVSWSREQVICLDSTGTVVGGVPVESPRKVAAYEGDGSIWVAAQWGVGRYSISGDRLFADSAVADPKDIAVDQRLGTCWVACGDGRVWARKLDGTKVWFYGFVYPFALAIDGISGDAWMVDAGAARVHRLRAGAGAEVDSVEGFVQPVDVAALPGRGAWVVDWEANSAVWVDGTTLVRTLEVGGFDRPRAVAVDCSTGTCWVVGAFDGRVVKMNETGEWLGWAGGLDFPRDIALETGR